jgi:hypothetical protein
VLDLYEKLWTDQIPYQEKKLDYPPLRLAVCAWYARWADANYPGGWRDDYEFMAPLLWLNSLCEISAAVLVYILIRDWQRRSAGVGGTTGEPTCPPAEPGAIGRASDVSTASISPRLRRGTPSTTIGADFVSLLGALLFWFNPAVIWDAHCWPQWDVWLFPFFLGALLLACRDWWFAAGVLIAIGAFLKGQILIAAPMFILWPLVQLKWNPILRWMSGFALAAGLIALPWMKPSTVALSCGLGISAAIVAVGWCCRRFLPRGVPPHASALAIAVVIFLMIPIFGASHWWYTVGFEFGTQKFMIMGHPSNFNLPVILQHEFRWAQDPNQLVDLPLVGAVAFRKLVLAIFGACLVLCAIGAAMHERRNDARFLVAFVAPWVCSFALLTQLNNRYMVWAAGMSALLAGVSVGMTLLGILMSIVAWAGIAQIMYSSAPYANQDMTDLLAPLPPHVGWVVLLMACAYLYVAVMPGVARRARTRSSTEDRYIG